MWPGYAAATDVMRCEGATPAYDLGDEATGGRGGTARANRDAKPFTWPAGHQSGMPANQIMVSRRIVPLRMRRAISSAGTGPSWLRVASR
jgi:hypothetical protein